MEPGVQPKKKIINVSDTELPVETISKEKIHRDLGERISTITKEFVEAFEFLKKYPKSVTFFGSSRFSEENPHYQQARTLGAELCKKGYTVISGGGPGIMEAANRGAYEACGKSVGFNIELPYEQNINPYVTDNLSFYYFFSRKVALTFSAEAYVYFPGGFGTLDEFYELITLMQTNKIPRAPMILVGRDFWEPLHAFMNDNLFERHRAIDMTDMQLYTITDDLDEVVRIVTQAQVRNEE